MVKDTLVGVLGALVIVGSMAGVIQALDSEETTGDGVGSAPPPAGDSRLVAERCRALTLTWNPDRAALEDVVGPHWTPAQGPVQGRGIFSLFAWECSTTTVDGILRGSDSGAAALVPIQTPGETRNVSADAWLAVPEVIGSGSSRVLSTFEEHGFTVTTGSGSVGTQSTLLTESVRMVIETPDGRLEASATIGGQAESLKTTTAVVGTSEDTFSVATGPEELERRTTGAATVQTSGTTWVEELGLAPQPSSVAYDTGFSFDFEVFDEPWSGGNATRNATLAR